MSLNGILLLNCPTSFKPILCIFRRNNFKKIITHYYKPAKKHYKCKNIITT